MCIYCEPLTNEKMDSYKHKYRELIKSNYWSNDFREEDVERMVGIIPPTPVSKKKHSEDGLTSILEIYLADDHRKIHHMSIPIKYCPICGKEIE